MLRAASVVGLVGSAAAHGHMTIPASTRNGGDFTTGGSCAKGQCFWFSNNVEIPGSITLPNEMRSLQLNVTGQPEDVYATSPWRAPGTAPVYGSGCGAAGGGPTAFANGGQPPPGVPQGTDGFFLPKHGTPEQWKRGSEVEVGWAISANHGGGYGYRLCKNNGDGNITEECFQANHLEFAGQVQWAAYSNGTRVEMPLRMTTVGTFPKGSQWARDPIPECYVCDAYKTCGAPLPPQPNDEEDDALESPEGMTCKAITVADCDPTAVKSGNGNCLKCAPGGGYHCETCCAGTTPTPYNGKGMNITYCAAPKKSNPWDDQVNCYGACAGATQSKAPGLGNGCSGELAFPEGAPGFSGFGKTVWPWSVVDKVKIPATLPAGDYLLSWRWDCEESTQVWQNCADVVLV